MIGTYILVYRCPKNTYTSSKSNKIFRHDLFFSLHISICMCSECIPSAATSQQGTDYYPVMGN